MVQSLPSPTPLQSRFGVCGYHLKSNWMIKQNRQILIVIFMASSFPYLVLSFVAVTLRLTKASSFVNVRPEPSMERLWPSSVPGVIPFSTVWFPNIRMPLSPASVGSACATPRAR